MCGIAGILELRKEARLSPAELRRMCDVMSHRGPDDEGIHTDGRLGIGMRRLSIVDLATGPTPSGYRWSTTTGPPFPVGSRALVRGEIAQPSVRPIDWVMPK